MSLLIVVHLVLVVSEFESKALLIAELKLKADTIWESLEGEVMEETNNSKKHTIHRARRGGYKRLKSNTT